MSKQSLDSTLFGRTVKDWVAIVHKKISLNYEMKQLKIKPGDFGFEAYASILVSILTEIDTSDVFKSIQGTLDKQRFVDTAHTAWINNYVFWKNYISADVDTSERNNRATTSFNRLEEYDRALYDDIISEVFAVLTQSVLEAGMQHLSI